jgi:hypothetical protein
MDALLGERSQLTPEERAQKLERASLASVPTPLAEAEPRSDAIGEHKVRPIAVVSGMRRIGQDRGRRTPADRGLAKYLPVVELLASQVDFDPGHESVPHVRHDPLAVEEHIGRHELTANEVVDDQRCHVALSASRILRRPAIVWIDGVRPPALSDRLFKLNERVHGGRR